MQTETVRAEEHTTVILHTTAVTVLPRPGLRVHLPQHEDPTVRPPGRAAVLPCVPLLLPDPPVEEPHVLRREVADAAEAKI